MLVRGVAMYCGRFPRKQRYPVAVSCIFANAAAPTAAYARSGKFGHQRVGDKVPRTVEVFMSAK